MSNFDFLKKDLEWKIVNLQDPVGTLSHNPTTHKWHSIISLLINRPRNTIYSWILTGCILHILRLRRFFIAIRWVLHSRSREKILLSWEVQKWVTNWDMSRIARWRTDERWTYGRTTADAVQTILLDYSIWTLNVCLCLSPAQTLNNTFGAKNSSTFSTALDDPSSIWTNIPCTCAHTIRQTISKNPIIIFGTMYSHLTKNSL